MNLNADTAQKLDFKNMGMPTLAWCESIDAIYAGAHDELQSDHNWIGPKDDMIVFAERLAEYFSNTTAGTEKNRFSVVLYFERDGLGMVSVINGHMEDDALILSSIAENILGDMPVFDIIDIVDSHFETTMDVNGLPDNYKQVINYLQNYGYLSKTATI